MTTGRLCGGLGVGSGLQYLCNYAKIIGIIFRQIYTPDNE